MSRDTSGAFQHLDEIDHLLTTTKDPSWLIIIPVPSSLIVPSSPSHHVVGENCGTKSTWSHRQEQETREGQKPEIQ